MNITLDKILPSDRLTRRVERFIALFVIAMIAVWLLMPFFTGFHIGFNAWTDHKCMTRVIQWCK